MRCCERDGSSVPGLRRGHARAFLHEGCWSRGFSLLEVLAVLGLLAILLLVTVPQLTAPDTLTASALARQIAVDLRLTRQLAVGKRCNYTLEFAPATAPYASYTVQKDPACPVDPDFPADFPKEIPTGVTVTGRQRFIFRPDGCVDDDGAGPQCAGTDGSVNVAAGPDTARVDVFWYNGRVEVVGP